MPRVIQSPQINGNRTSYCDIQFGVAGLRLKGVNSLDYGDNHDIPKVKGMSSKRIGRTQGDEDPDGEMEILQAEWNVLLPIITVAGKFGYAQIAWPLTVTYATLLSPEDTVTDYLHGVRIHSARPSIGQSNDAIAYKLKLSIMEIRWAGLYVGIKDFPPL
jgi:hypothetical protein